VKPPLLFLLRFTMKTTAATLEATKTTPPTPINMKVVVLIDVECSVTHLLLKLEQKRCTHSSVTSSRAMLQVESKVQTWPLSFFVVFSNLQTPVNFGTELNTQDVHVVNFLPFASRILIRWPGCYDQGRYQ